MYPNDWSVDLCDSHNSMSLLVSLVRMNPGSIEDAGIVDFSHVDVGTEGLKEITGLGAVWYHWRHMDPQCETHS